MTTQTEAERLADAIRTHEHHPQYRLYEKAAAELRRLASFNQQLMDEVARLNKAVDDEREACARVCDEVDKESQSQWPKRLATMIRARGNT